MSSTVGMKRLIPDILQYYLEDPSQRPSYQNQSLHIWSRDELLSDFQNMFKAKWMFYITVNNLVERMECTCNT